jgi:CHAT domain-containing protein
VFEPLPGSAMEADAIAADAVPADGVLRLSGAGATRDAFVEDAPGRRVLHLATHAYVLPERCGAHRPLLRSGLAFAGANRGREAGRVAGAGDGILTAEEIASLDLSGVEWVVLSACETGLGEVRAGEGVVGLRRAFERAGAGTVIMSLWDVDDGAARAFMRALYASRRSGLPTSEAMREAGLGILARQRALGRSTHPYFWGGFTAIGDWH